MRLSGKSSEGRNRRSDPQFSERFSNSAPTTIHPFSESKLGSIRDGEERKRRVFLGGKESHENSWNAYM